MLKIPTYIDSSLIPNAGLGLFCKTEVLKDTLIWQFDPGLDRIVSEIPDDPIVRGFINTYGYKPIAGITGYVVCLDNARFMNHGKDHSLNCRCDPDGTTWALRDLKAGEELICDYTSFCADDLETVYHTYLGFQTQQPPNLKRRMAHEVIFHKRVR